LFEEGLLILTISDTLKTPFLNIIKSEHT